MHFWHGPLGVHSAKHKHQSAEWNELWSKEYEAIFATAWQGSSMSNSEDGWLLQTNTEFHFILDKAVSEWVSSVLRPHQHSIGYTGDGFYRS